MEAVEGIRRFGAGAARRSTFTPGRGVGGGGRMGAAPGWLGAAVLLAAGLCGAGRASAQAQLFSLTDYSGAELYQQFCSACHGPTAHGDGPVAATLNVMVPDLTRLAERHGGRFPVDQVRAMIDGRSLIAAHGTRTMPVWGYEFWVTEGADRQAEADARQVINRLVLYLESVQAPDVRGLPQ